MGDVLDFDGRRHFGETERKWPWESKPAFGKGNTMAMTHGAFADSVVSARAEEIRAELLERFDFLADEMFQPAIERYLRPAARARILNDWVDGVMAGEIEVRDRGAGSTGIAAVPERVWRALNQAETAAQKFAQDCGLDPIGFARVAKELGWAKQLGQNRVQDLASKGRELRRGSA